MKNELSSPAIPEAIAEFLKPKLLVTEKREDYDALLAFVAQTILPRNNLEWISTALYVNKIWEIRRLASGKVDIINATRYDAFRTVFETILPETEDRLELAASLAQAWFEEPEKRPELLARLEKYDLDDGAVSSQAAALRGSDLEKIDRMMQQLESSSMAYLREIEFHRRVDSWRAPELIEGGAGPVLLPPPTSSGHSVAPNDNLASMDKSA